MVNSFADKGDEGHPAVPREDHPGCEPAVPGADHLRAQGRCRSRQRVQPLVAEREFES